MHSTLTHSGVKPEHTGTVIAVTRAHHQVCVRKAGCLRCDEVQSAEDPGRVVLHEAYGAAVAAAFETGHHLSWCEKLASWVAKSRLDVRCDGLCPLS